MCWGKAEKGGEVGSRGNLRRAGNGDHLTRLFTINKASNLLIPLDGAPELASVISKTPISY